MKQKEIKKLTWMYFIDQKVKEIVGGVLFLSIVFLILYNLGKSDFLGICLSANTTLLFVLCGFTSLLLILIIITFVALALLLLYYLLYCIFGKWISSNWEKARKKAREELR